MIMFAAATGLRPSELFALERGDVDRAAGVVHVRRAYANGRVKQTKTRLSRRAVPLQAIALEALDQLAPREDSPLLFPNARGALVRTPVLAAPLSASRPRSLLASTVSAFSQVAGGASPQSASASSSRGTGLPCSATKQANRSRPCRPGKRSSPTSTPSASTATRPARKTFSSNP